MGDDTRPGTTPDNSYLARAIAEAKEIWSDAILPERVEAKKRAAAFSRDTVDELARMIVETSDDERIADNRKYIAAALVLLRNVGIDEYTL